MFHGAGSLDSAPPFYLLSFAGIIESVEKSFVLILNIGSAIE